MRQLTDGPFDDIEPTYLPDGDIVFCSSRCNRWVVCWKVPVAILYRCDADGGNIRMLSSNAVTENTPAVLPDGRLLYTRWEYVDRSQLCYHHLWTINPDGTGQMTYFGNMHPTGMPYNLAGRVGQRGRLQQRARRRGDARRQADPRHARASWPSSRPAMAAANTRDSSPSSIRAAARTTSPRPGAFIPDGDWRDPYPLSADAVPGRPRTGNCT